MAYCNEQNLGQRVRLLDIEEVDEKVTKSADAGADTLKHDNVRRLVYVNDAVGAGPDDPDYTQDTDYELVDDTVSWGLGGSEPTQGNAYYVTYEYRALTIQEVRQNIREADAIIDGYLAGAGYTLPFDTTPDLCRTIATSLAAWGCGRDVYARTGKEIPERIESDYEKAMQWLDMIADGKMKVVESDGTAGPTRQILSSTEDYQPTFDMDPVEDSVVDPDRLDDIDGNRG